MRTKSTIDNMDSPVLTMLPVDVQAPIRNMQRPVAQHKVVLFWLAIVFTLSFYGAHMNFAPFLYSDELVNVELGRTFLEPNTDWSIVWLTEKGHPVLLFSYAGVVIQELVYKWMGAYSVRVFTLVGAGFAAFTLFHYLRQLAVPHTIAMLSGLLLMWDPVFVQSYTKGRIDSWALAACLCSCTLIQQSYRIGYWPNRRTLFFAGGTAVLAVFIWPSAGFLLPLLLASLLNCLIVKEKRFTIRKPGSLLWLIAGSILTLVILFIPMYSVFQTNFDRFLDGMQYNLKSGRTAHTSATSIFKENLSEYFRLMRFSPVVLLLGLLGLLLKSNRSFLIAFTIALALASFTLVYINRIIYLLPYLYIGFASCAQIFQQNFAKHKILSKIPLYSALCWSLLISVGLWSVLANSNINLRKRENLTTIANSFALPKESKTLCFSYEFYYQMRDFKWKLFTPYHVYNEPVTARMVGQIIPLVDHVIVPDANHMEASTADLLQKNGFEPVKNAGTGPAIAAASWEQLWLAPRLRNFFGIPLQPYASYTLFERQRHS